MRFNLNKAPNPAAHSTPEQTTPASRRWVWIFIAAALEGLAALIFLASLPSDAAGRGGLGYSASRLVLMLGILALAAGFAFAASLVSRPRRGSGWLTRRGWFSQRGWVARGLFVLLPPVALACVLLPVILFSLYINSGEFRYFAVYQRLLPVFIWLGVVSLELFAGVAWTGEFRWAALRGQRRVFLAGLVAWAAFGIAGIFVVVTGIGLRPDVVGWGLPTVPLLEWQLWLAWGAGILFLLFLAFRGWNARRDWLIAAAIWLLAAGLWLGQPIRPAFFATAGRAPNYEIYPFSDGAYYGSFAQSILIGNGFKGDEIPPRPFYITLLAGFHALSGQKYENIIALQTLFLAFFPVVLFFLGKELHSRPTGLVVALLAILREVTAIITTPFTDNASNSKLFFADLPTALVISLWVWLVVRWLKAPGGRGRALLPLVVGGSIGLAMLFRTQSMFMILAVLLAALFVYRGRWDRWLRSVGLVVLGLALIVTPWLARNYSVTGQVAFDDSKSQTGSMAARYSLDGNDLSFMNRPGEDPREYSGRVTKGIFDFLFAHPGIVAGFVTAHFVNAEIANVFVLPVRNGLAATRELLMPSNAFWEFWRGTLAPGQLLLFLLNLGLIALGVGAGWRRLGWAGLIPLLSNLSYNFSMSLARNSGGRYLLAVDWAAYLYAAVGLVEIAAAVLAVLGIDPRRLASLLASKGEMGSEPSSPARVRSSVLIALALVAVGSILPLVELVVPQRYADRAPETLAAEVLQDARLAQSGINPVALERFLAQPGARIIEGRGLYPRYYAAGEGEPRTAKTAYEPLNYPRTVFLIASNHYNGLAVLRAPYAPASFPNAADVLAVGCAGDYLDVAVLIVKGQPGSATIFPGLLTAGCPAAPAQ